MIKKKVLRIFSPKDPAPRDRTHTHMKRKRKPTLPQPHKKRKREPTLPQPHKKPLFRKAVPWELSCEMWENVLGWVTKMSDLVSVMLARRDHYLYTIASKRVRKKRLQAVHQAIYDLHTAAPGVDPVVAPDKDVPAPPEAVALLTYLDLGADRIPEMFLRVFHKYVHFFSNYSFRRPGSAWCIETNIVPFDYFRIPPEYHWFLSVNFHPTNDEAQAYEMKIFQEQHVHESHGIGEALRTFFQRFGFRTRLLRRRCNGDWDDCLDDEDYNPEDHSASDWSDSEEGYLGCIRCGHFTCTCRFCWLCRQRLMYCLCDVCSGCKYDRDECQCVVV